MKKTATLQISIGTLFEALQIPSFNMIIEDAKMNNKILELRIKGFDERLGKDFENNRYNNLGLDNHLPLVYTYSDEGEDNEKV
jgi:hypothetical protein